MHDEANAGWPARMHSARGAVVENAKRCIAHALELNLADTAEARQLFVSDEVFRRLHRCVHELMRSARDARICESEALRALELALDEATAGGATHPAVRASALEWGREAYADPSPGGRSDD